MARTVSYTVGNEYDGKTVALFLRRCVGLSCGLVRSLKVQPEGILLNGAHTRTIDRIKSGDKVSVTFPDETSSVGASAAQPNIVYEDDDVLVINKPHSLAMHPTHNHQGDTLANEVQGHFERAGKNCLFRAVGRLDKDTSGLVVCALNKYSAATLQANVEKTYFAVAQGSFEGEGTIDRPIFRPDPMKTLRAVGDCGERAVTHWHSLGTSKGHSLLQIKLETGRTHQIRVHFASLGSPLAGDDMYGGSRELIGRHALHCGEISFIHPLTKEKMFFYVPMPEDMQHLLDKLNLHIF